MLRTLGVLAVVLGLAAVGTGVSVAQSKDKGAQGKAAPAKEETLKGTITCAKCDLGKESKCMTVVKVTDGGTETVYYFDDAAHKKHHPGVCTTPKDGTVVGKVTEKDGKKVVTVTKVEFKK